MNKRNSPGINRHKNLYFKILNSISFIKKRAWGLTKIAVFSILLILLSTPGLQSCKTCECPAYSTVAKKQTQITQTTVALSDKTNYNIMFCSNHNKKMNDQN